MCVCVICTKSKDERIFAFVFVSSCPIYGRYLLSRITDWFYWLEIRGKCVNEPLLLFMPDLSSSLARVSSWPVVSWTLKSIDKRERSINGREESSYKNRRYYSRRYCCHWDWWYYCLLFLHDNVFEILGMNVLILFQQSKDDEDLLLVLNVRQDPIYNKMIAKISFDWIFTRNIDEWNQWNYYQLYEEFVLMVD